MGNRSRGARERPKGGSRSRLTVRSRRRSGAGAARGAGRMKPARQRSLESSARPRPRRAAPQSAPHLPGRFLHGLACPLAQRLPGRNPLPAPGFKPLCPTACRFICLSTFLFTGNLLTILFWRNLTVLNTRRGTRASQSSQRSPGSSSQPRPSSGCFCRLFPQRPALPGVFPSQSIQTRVTFFQ